MIIHRSVDISQQELSKFCQNGIVAIDTETTGLDFMCDRLCTIQIYCKEQAVIIKYCKDCEYPNLKYLLASKNVRKVFHNATFDVSFLMKNLGYDCINNIVCTKIGSKIINGLNHDNSLKGLLKEYLQIIISKNQQLSDWTKEELSEEQVDYAMNDVRYLEELWYRIKDELVRCNLYSEAETCFQYIPTYVKLQEKGISNIFVY